MTVEDPHEAERELREERPTGRMIDGSPRDEVVRKARLVDEEVADPEESE